MIHGRGDEADDARVRRAEPVGARDNRLGYGTLFGGRRRTADALGLAGRTGRVDDRAGRDLRRLQRRADTKPGIPPALAAGPPRSPAKALGPRDFGGRVARTGEARG